MINLIKVVKKTIFLFLLSALISCAGGGDSLPDTGGNSDTGGDDNNTDPPIDNTELYRVERNNLWGFINRLGETIITFQFQEANQFENGYAIVKSNNLWGVINTNGEYIVDPNYDYLFTPREGFFVARLNGRYGYIDLDGNVIGEIDYDRCFYFNDGIAAVQRNGLWGFINTNFETVIDYQYAYAGPMSNGRAFVSQTGINTDMLFAIIDESNNRLSEYIYKPPVFHKNSMTIIYAPLFRNGISNIVVNDKACIINTNQDILVETNYDFLSHFSEGLACFEVNDVFGYINTSGTEVIPLSDHSSRPGEFLNGYTFIKNEDNMVGFINKQNTTIIPFDYKNAKNFTPKLAEVQFSDNYWGYIDINNDIIWRSSEPVQKLDIIQGNDNKFNLIDNCYEIYN